MQKWKFFSQKGGFQPKINIVGRKVRLYIRHACHQRIWQKSLQFLAKMVPSNLGMNRQTYGQIFFLRGSSAAMFIHSQLYRRRK